MENYIRIKVNPNTQEIDFEIPVSEWDRFSPLVLPAIEKFNQRIKDEFLPAPITKSEQRETEVSEKIMETDSFGELLLHLKSNKDVDRVLLTGYFLQHASTTKDFSSLEVTSLLREHGHSPSNTSAFISQNNNTKKIFKVSGNRFRVSAVGIQYLQELLGK